MSDISDIFNWFSGLEFFGIKLGLEQTRALFSLLGNPERSLRFIHIAGSNGKGSTAAFLESALRHAGFRTGLYTSPHLARVNERFAIDGAAVPDGLLADALERVREAARTLLERDMRITYFEAATAAAALIFAGRGVEFVVWETGMGGRLDATNIITSGEAAASVITTISLEHREYLGGTLSKIAYEKAGIIKSGVPLFLGSSIPREALDVILARAEELGAPVFRETRVPEMVRTSREGVFFCQELESGLKISLAGAHQRANAALALRVLEHLAPEYGIGLEKARAGFAETVWPARLQFFPGENLLIDGAHNPECAQILADALRELFPGSGFDFIFGAFADKESVKMLETLAPLGAEFDFIPIASNRKCASPVELAENCRKIDPDIPARVSTLKEALARPSPRLKVLCGSLHLCGEYLAMREKKAFD